MIDAEEIHFSLVDTVHDLDFPLTLGLEDTWCWPLSCILGVTCVEEIEGPYHQDHVMCVTKLGGSSETVAAKVLDRKCVKNEHEHSSQVCIRAQPRFDYGSTKPVAGNLSLPSPVHDNVSSRYERDSHPVWSRPGRIPDENLKEHFVQEEV